MNKEPIIQVICPECVTILQIDTQQDKICWNCGFDCTNEDEIIRDDLVS